MKADERHLALDAGAPTGACSYDGPFGVMSFDPRIPRLLKTNLPRGSTRPGRSRLPAAVETPRCFCGLPIPDFIAVERTALAKPWVARFAAADARLQLDHRTPEQRVASAGSRRRTYLGSRWPTAKLKSLRSSRRGVSGLNARAWDRLAGDDPFVSHAFLSALEIRAAWARAPAGRRRQSSIEDGTDRSLAAAPAYLKSHSQGEYVFDHGWADACERAGGHYYPKLQIAVPFTPVPGPRLLGDWPQQLLAAVEAVTVQNDISSAHITFIDEAGAAECERRGWLIRYGIQYHWHNRGYRDFDDFLAALSSRKRKTIRKERAAAREGLEFRALRGDEIGAAEWDCDVALLPGHRLAEMGPALPDARVLRPDRQEHGRPGCCCSSPIATASRSPAHSTSSAPDTLYGRYWGALEEVPFLHFELCYYQAIEWAIEHGLTCVQAGAQGEHKLARGYEPVITRSAHFIADPRLSRRRRGVPRERARRRSRREVEWLRRDLPYRSSSSA